jgi:hypothetical protein
MEESNVYLLKFPDIEAFKVGKSDNIINRLMSLKKYWGEPDFESSVSISIDKRFVFKLENMLKNALDQYQIKGLSGDGMSELFELSAFPVSLKYLDIYVDDCDFNIEIKKGIDKPNPTPSGTTVQLKGDSYKCRTIDNNIKHLYSSFSESSESLLKTIRLMGFLSKYRHKIPMKFEYDKPYAKLRFWDNKYSRTWVKMAHKYFKISIGHYSRSFCIARGENTKLGVIKAHFYLVFNSSDMDDRSIDFLHCFFSRQFIDVLNRIERLDSYSNLKIPDFGG